MASRPDPDPSAKTAATTEAAEVARRTGFEQCVPALRRTLATTPAGWMLVAWMAWGRVPQPQIALWLGLFVSTWLFNLWILHRVARAGASLDRHARQVLFVAGLDGLGWGSTVWLLMGFDPLLDPWLSAVLCGIAAINAPVYITYIRAYRVQIGSLWAVIMLGSALSLRPGRVPLEGLFGLTVFYGLLVYYMQPIAARVLDGIRLQLANASLAAQLQTALSAVQQDAATDALTGLPNRRALDSLLAQQVELAESTGQPVSALLLDIDHFKAINDVHGHGVGDDALRAFARRVRQLLREGDVCARYGGEEFVVVLPATTLSVACEVAERLRRGVADERLLSVPALKATVSIGAAEYSAGQTVEGLLAAADGAVYAAKHGGRNQVRLAQVPAQVPAAVPQSAGSSSQISLRRRNQGVNGGS